VRGLPAVLILPPAGLEAALLQMNEAKKGARFGGVRLKFLKPPATIRCIFQIALVIVSNPQVRVGRTEPRIDLQGLLVADGGGGKIPSTLVKVPKSKNGFGAIGLEGECARVRRR